MKDSTLNERKSILRLRTVLTFLEEEYDTEDTIKAKEFHDRAIVNLSLWSNSVVLVGTQDNVSRWFEKESHDIEKGIKRISQLLKEKE